MMTAASLTLGVLLFLSCYTTANSAILRGKGSTSDDLADRPTLIYGTLWSVPKSHAFSDHARDVTADLVYKAIKSGFRHIDTATQPRHYNEEGVGIGWKKAAAELDLEREDLWIQTKFTGIRAHDPVARPYDADASIPERVRQSLAKSLGWLQTDYVDSLLMHSPEMEWKDHWEIWHTMEALVDEGKVGQLGLSNFDKLDELKYAYEHARIKPKVVQNHFHVKANHDVEIRKFCNEHDIEYQAFRTLASNKEAYRHEAAVNIAKEKGLTPEGMFFAFVMAIGMTPLVGTMSEKYMKEDIELLDRIRSGDEIFKDADELRVIGDALGTPGWEVVDVEEL